MLRDGAREGLEEVRTLRGMVELQLARVAAYQYAVLAVASRAEEKSLEAAAAPKLQRLAADIAGLVRGASKGEGLGN